MAEVAAVGAGLKSATATGATLLITSIFFGTFNPEYKKDDQRRMRYIQSKYSKAYGTIDTISSNDPTSIITKIDPNSKILMAPDGKKPANPFPDERSYEESLIMNFHPISGHQGRFSASHSLSCIGAIIDYQVKRLTNTYVPGILPGKGKPNDYINLFLDEIKTWLRTQLNQDNVHAEELERRNNYLRQIKNDNYYWCFPIETKIHNLIDFIHDKILNALEIVTIEEKNKSLQLLFKELNDNVTNSFEFGKNFMAYLLSTSLKLGTDLSDWFVLDGETLETGLLHRLLERLTDTVLKSYVSEIRCNDYSIEDNTNSSNSNDQFKYNVTLRDIETNITSILYKFEIKEPNGNKWIIVKKESDFELLHKEIYADYLHVNKVLTLPAKKKMLTFVKEDNDERGCIFEQYLMDSLNWNGEVKNSSRLLVCKFVDTKSLICLQNIDLVQPETVVNSFILLKEKFKCLIMTKEDINNSINNKENSTIPKLENCKKGKDDEEIMLLNARETWGVGLVVKIMEAYALLQRMSTLLSWTLEINHFFVSMFGNTLAFSKLPLQELLSTQKDILNSFLTITTDLFNQACKLNSEQKFKFHKNLQATESQLNVIKHHITKSVDLINKIESNHLDYEVQLKRLQNVQAKFMPFMERIDGNLGNIQQELGLSSKNFNNSKFKYDLNNNNNNKLIIQCIEECDSKAIDKDNNDKNFEPSKPTATRETSRPGSRNSLNVEKTQNEEEITSDNSTRQSESIGTPVNLELKLSTKPFSIDENNLIPLVAENKKKVKLDNNSKKDNSNINDYKDDYKDSKDEIDDRVKLSRTINANIIGETQKSEVCVIS